MSTFKSLFDRLNRMALLKTPSDKKMFSNAFDQAFQSTLACAFSVEGASIEENFDAKAALRVEDENGKKTSVQSALETLAAGEESTLTLVLEGSLWDQLLRLLSNKDILLAKVLEGRTPPAGFVSNTGIEPTAFLTAILVAVKEVERAGGDYVGLSSKKESAGAVASADKMAAKMATMLKK